MTEQERRRTLPGRTILGGAACGLSYEGVCADALAREERARRREAGHSRPVPQQRPARPPLAARPTPARQ